MHQQPETPYDGSDYNIRPAYHFKKWKKKKHFIQQITPIYIPEKTDVSVSDNSIGTHISGHSSSTFSNVTRSLNPHHRLYTVPITLDVILEQNSKANDSTLNENQIRSKLFSDYLSIVNKPSYVGVIDDHDTSNDLLFTGKVNPLPKELMEEQLYKNIKNIQRLPIDGNGGKSRALLNDLIDEIEGIIITFLWPAVILF